MAYPSLNQRQHADAATAQERFAESTRAGAFQLTLSIKEIRILSDQGWETAFSWPDAERHTLQRLVDKGLVLHDSPEGKPTLSKAGELVRALLILSRHIVVYS